MHIPTEYWLFIVTLCFFTACSTGHTASQPILERADQSQLTDTATMSKDVHACRSDIRKEAPMTIQPRWLPPLGLTDSGVVLGTVGNSHPTWPSQEAYRQALARCLTGRGYEIRGWQ